MTLLGLSMMSVARGSPVNARMTATLYPLSLDALTIAEDQVTGTKVGTIIRGAPGSTITLQAQSNANMFALSNGDINVGAAGLDFETAPTPTITLRETLAGAVNTPKDTVITITVTDVVEAQASWPSLIGAEMMVNGDCSSSTGWGLPAGAVIAADKMTLTALTDNIDNTGIDGTNSLLLVGASYRTVFTIDSRSAGSIAWVNGLTGTSRSTAGTFSQDLVATDLTAALSATSASMVLDNFSVKSVGLLGVEADWSLAGGAWIWVADGSFGPAGVLSCSGAGLTDIASLTGSALTSFTSAVSFNAAILVSFYVPSGAYGTGDVSVRVHQGSWVAAGISADGWSTPVAVTSGSVAGFDVRGNAGATTELVIAAVQIALV